MHAHAGTHRERKRGKMQRARGGAKRERERERERGRDTDLVHAACNEQPAIQQAADGCSTARSVHIWQFAPAGCCRTIAAGGAQEPAWIKRVDRADYSDAAQRCAVVRSLLQLHSRFLR